jgi:hypothetical protein
LMSSLTTGSRRKLVGLEQVLRKRDCHRWVYVGGKRISTHRAALQIPVGGQARFGLGFFVVKVGDPLFSDIAGVVNSILSLLVRIVQLVERLLVFHVLSLRCSHRHQARGFQTAPCRKGWAVSEGRRERPSSTQPEEVSRSEPTLHGYIPSGVEGLR